MSSNSTRRVYVDTSCYLSVLLGESQSKNILTHLQGNVLCSSVMLLIEAERNLVRLTRENILQHDDFETALAQLKKDRELFILRDVTPDICLSGTFPAVKTPRSIDLIHLRTAVWFFQNGGLLSFVSLDQHQLEAASELGLPLVKRW